MELDCPLGGKWGPGSPEFLGKNRPWLNVPTFMGFIVNLFAIYKNERNEHTKVKAWQLTDECKHLDACAKKCLFLHLPR